MIKSKEQAMRAAEKLGRDSAYARACRAAAEINLYELDDDTRIKIMYLLKEMHGSKTEDQVTLDVRKSSAALSRWKAKEEGA
jgi:hypothetical protein